MEMREGHMLAQTIISARAVYRFEVKHIGNLDLPVSAATPRKTRIVRLAQNLTQKEETSYASSRLEQRRQEVEVGGSCRRLFACSEARL